MANSQLTEEQLTEFRDAFQVFDKSGEGVISVPDLGLVMRKLGLMPSEQELQDLIDEIDPDGSIAYNGLSFENFCTIAARKVDDVFSTETIADAFRVFDKEGNGFIAAAEVRHVLTAMGERLTEEEMDALIEAADVDQDGNIRYEEFVQKMMEP